MNRLRFLFYTLILSLISCGLVVGSSVSAASYNYWSNSVNAYVYDSSGSQSIRNISSWSSNLSSLNTIDWNYSIGGYCAYFGNNIAKSGEYFTLSYGEVVYTANDNGVEFGGFSGREATVIEDVTTSNINYSANTVTDRSLAVTLGGHFESNVSWVCWNHVIQGSNGISFTFRLSKPSLTVYSSKSDYTSALNSIQSSLSSVNSNLITLNNSVNSLNSNVSSQSDTIIQKLESVSSSVSESAGVASDTYNKTVEDETKANDSANQSQSQFSFTFPNILGWLVGGLSDGCINAPTIAEWTHSTTSEFCPVFPQKVRNVITPIVNVIVILFVYKGAFKWLKGMYGEDV